MENEKLMVTIPLERYDELLRVEFMFDDFSDLVEELLNHSELNWNKEDLDFKNDDIRNLIKRYDINLYRKKVNMLKSKDGKNE